VIVFVYDDESGKYTLGDDQQWSLLEGLLEVSVMPFSEVDKTLNEIAFII
jgi:hypothetical protein